MALLEENLGRHLHYRYFFAFGSVDLITPQANILKWLDDGIDSPTVRIWMYSVYKKIISAQMTKATELKNMFRETIEGADDMSAVRLKEALEDKAIRFRNIADLVLTEMEKKGWVKKVNNEKIAMRNQNKRDAEEFSGRTLPDPAEVLPRFFNDEGVKVTDIVSI